MENIDNFFNQIKYITELVNQFRDESVYDIETVLQSKKVYRELIKLNKLLEKEIWVNKIK